MATRADVVAYAATWIGHRDPAGRKVWDAVGQTGAYGQPWCAAFTQMVFARFGMGSQLAAALPFFVPSLESFARARGTWAPVGSIISTNMASPGDVILFDWEADGIDDHVGIVESITAGSVTTIEGNTAQSDGGDQSNGGWVARRTRYPRHIRGFIRMNYSAAAVSQTEDDDDMGMFKDRADFEAAVRDAVSAMLGDSRSGVSRGVVGDRMFDQYLDKSGMVSLKQEIADCKTLALGAKATLAKLTADVSSIKGKVGA